MKSKILSNITNKIKLKIAKFKVKKYDNLIFLGYNCEIAYRFYQVFKYTNSSLFAWSGVEDINKTLNNLDTIGTNGFEYKPEMHVYQCNASTNLFHGRSDIKDELPQEEKDKLIESDIIDLTSRLAYLKNKFKKQLSDGGKNLFIRKVRYFDFYKQAADINKKIEQLYDFIQKNCKNEFDLLLVIEKKYAKYLKINKKNVFIRTVEAYSSDACVIDDPNADVLGWKLIFTEFLPLKRPEHINKNKLKFEKDK